MNYALRISSPVRSAGGFPSRPCLNLIDGNLVYDSIDCPNQSIRNHDIPDRNPPPRASLNFVDGSLVYDSTEYPDETIRNYDSPDRNPTPFFDWDLVLDLLLPRFVNRDDQIGRKKVKRYLKTKSYSGNEIEKSEVCVVCQSGYEAGEKMGCLKCGHDYHLDCVKEWLLQKNVCPVCRRTALPGEETI